MKNASSWNTLTKPECDGAGQRLETQNVDLFKRNPYPSRT